MNLQMTCALCKFQPTGEQDSWHGLSVSWVVWGRIMNIHQYWGAQCHKWRITLLLPKHGSVVSTLLCLLPMISQLKKASSVFDFHVAVTKHLAEEDKKTLRGRHISQDGQKSFHFMQQNPEVLQQVMSVLMNTIIFGDCRNQWSASRPLLGLTLLNEKVTQNMLERCSQSSAQHRGLRSQGSGCDLTRTLETALTVL
ncbi:ran-binding protein 17 isoform 1-T1 [Cyanocitta cristata]